MRRTHIRLKTGDSIPSNYMINDADTAVVWNCPFVVFNYEEGVGIKIDIYAEDKEKIDILIDHFIVPLLSTLPKYYYYGRMWRGTFDGLMNGDFQEEGKFVVPKNLFPG